MTREENLKKINAELEMLSDDELDAVAGGWLRRTCINEQQNLTQNNNQINGGISNNLIKR